MNYTDKSRLRIGIIFNFSPHWMGGIIYILNLIRMLNFLNDEDKPEITLFYRKDLKVFLDNIDYPYLNNVEWIFPSIYKGYLQSWITRRNVFIDKILKHYELDSLYPLHDYPVKTETRTKLVSWYADLQHEYYPGFFTRQKIFERRARIGFIIRNSRDLVVSSQTVADDFSRFFKLKYKIKIHIFHFVSIIDDLKDMNIEEIRVKHNLPSKYFMVSNQFHPHKNHEVILKAMILLNKKGVKVNCAFTGRFPNESNSSYLQGLHDLINDNNLHQQIVFLGVIPRAEQLLLMKYSQAVIQPTLFEGWSTVIEDAISLQVPVVASNLPVNIEQLGISGIYFDPYNPSHLSDILMSFPERNLDDILYEDYTKRVKNAAENFIKIFY